MAYALLLSTLALSAIAAAQECSSGKVVITPQTFLGNTPYGETIKVVNEALVKRNFSQYTPMVVGDYIQLQDQSTIHSANAVWHALPICPELFQGEFYMQYTFKYQKGDTDKPADGLATVLQSDGPNAVGDSGNAVGVENLYGRGNITNAVALQARYYGSGLSLFVGSTSEPSNRGQTMSAIYIEGEEYTVRVVGSLTRQKITLADSNKTELIAFDQNRDLSSVLLTGKNIYFGVTSATGSSTAVLLLKEAVISAGKRVTNSLELVEALADGIGYIVLAPGSYSAPSDGKGFRVTRTGTNIMAEINSESTITCGGIAKATGLSVEAAGVYVHGIVVRECTTGISVTSPDTMFDMMSVQDNSNNDDGTGAGFHLLDMSVSTILNSNIANNIGVGIYNYGSVNVMNTVINENNVGIIGRYNSRSIVQNSHITGNKGSGMFASENSYIGVSASDISGNTGALYGGGIGAVNSMIFVENSNITNNSALQSGGGIYLSSVDDAITLKIINSVVADNIAFSDEDLFFPENPDSQIVDSKISAEGTAHIYCCGGSLTSTPDHQYCNYPANECSSAN